MHQDEPLLPPLSVIQERLTRNQRERSLLRSLFRLAIRAAKDRRGQEPDRLDEQAERREVAQ